MTTPTLPDILLQILVTATRALRDIHIRAATAQTLKAILTANLAGARIGRAIRLATLLIRRIHLHGLDPLPRTTRPRPTPATPATRHARAPNGDPKTPRFHTGNADDAFTRRPIPAVIAAITRELHLAARLLGLPLPEHLQTLCLQAALISGPLHPTLAPLPESKPKITTGNYGIPGLDPGIHAPPPAQHAADEPISEQTQPPTTPAPPPQPPGHRSP